MKYIIILLLLPVIVTAQKTKEQKVSYRAIETFDFKSFQEESRGFKVQWLEGGGYKTLFEVWKRTKSDTCMIQPSPADSIFKISRYIKAAGRVYELKESKSDYFFHRKGDYGPRNNPRLDSVKANDIIWGCQCDSANTIKMKP